MQGGHGQGQAAPHSGWQERAPRASLHGWWGPGKPRPLWAGSMCPEKLESRRVLGSPGSSALPSWPLSHEVGGRMPFDRQQIASPLMGITQVSDSFPRAHICPHRVIYSHLSATVSACLTCLARQGPGCAIIPQAPRALCTEAGQPVVLAAPEAGSQLWGASH